MNDFKLIGRIKKSKFNAGLKQAIPVLLVLTHSGGQGSISDRIMTANYFRNLPNKGLFTTVDIPLVTQHLGYKACVLIKINVDRMRNITTVASSTFFY